MSLNGNLEDLPLLDILQIVSFSRKTGYLSIRPAAGEGAIVFKDGFVVASFSWDTPPMDPRAANLAPEKRDSLLRSRIAMALEQLIRLREGHFSFSLTDEPPQFVGTRDISQEKLANGINAQELLIDLARGMDEDRRDSAAALEASFAEAPEPPAEAPEPAAEPTMPEPDYPEPATPAAEEDLGIPLTTPSATPSAAVSGAPAAPSAAGEPHTILLADDEQDVRRILAEHFTKSGFQVVEAEDPEAAVKKGSRLGKANIPFVLVTDLGMPTSGGTSFQGGFEVVKRLWKMNLRPPVLLMTESLNSAIQARARQMGIGHFVFKPGLSKLDPAQFEADLKAFASKILSDILPRLVRPPAAEPARPAPPPAPRPAAPALPTAEELSRELDGLHKRLESLRGPKEAAQVSALVMEVAREFFERGILFLIKNDEVRGLSGFGPAPRDEPLHLVARDIVIPLSEPSVFGRTAAVRKPFSGPMPDDKWVRSLMGKIGRFRSSEAALLPLLTHREAIALLWGDNPETGQPLGRLDSLAVFINQAGIALENTLLQRKVHALQAQE